MKHSDIAHFRQLNMLRRRFHSRVRRFPPVLEPAAMVDVVLLVLLFFMISSSYVTRPGIEIQLPDIQSESGLPMNSLVVTLTRGGQIFFQDRRFESADLVEALKRAHRERPEYSLVIKADGEVPVSLQMQIYEKGLLAGIERIALATRGTRREME
jgi:biopolymer transport protein ExbD